MLTLLVSNIHRLKNANFYSRQIKLVYSKSSKRASSLLSRFIMTTRHRKTYY